MTAHGAQRKPMTSQPSFRFARRQRTFVCRRFSREIAPKAARSPSLPQVGEMHDTQIDTNAT
jgi:hypothetical protein